MGGWVMDIDFDAFDDSGNYNCVCCGEGFRYDGYGFRKEDYSGLLIGDDEYYGLARIQKPSVCCKCLGMKPNAKLDKDNTNGLFYRLCIDCRKYKKCSHVTDGYGYDEFCFYEFDADMEIEDICEEFGEYEETFVCRVDYADSSDDKKVYAFRCEKSLRFVLLSTEHFRNNGTAKIL